MRRHVVITFGGVFVKIVPIRDESAEKAVEVPPNAGICVFLDQERGAGVLNVQRAETRLQTGLADQIGDLLRDFVKTASLGRHGDFMALLP